MTINHLTNTVDIKISKLMLKDNIYQHFKLQSKYDFIKEL